MAKKATRTRKGPVKGVTATSYGWRFVTRIGGVPVRKSVTDPHHTMDRVTLKNDFADWKAEERKKMGRPETTKGTFAADVYEKYLPDTEDRKDYNDRKWVMGLWVKEFGKKPSGAIEATAITRVAKRWMREGPLRKCVKWDADHPKPKDCKTGRWIEVPEPVSVFRVSNRISMLEAFFTHVYPGKLNPARQAAIRKGDKPTTPRRDIDYGTLEAVIAAMNTRGRAEKGKKRPGLSKSQARAAVMMYTGIPQAQIKLIEPHDLHLDDKKPWMFKRGRNKGRGTQDGAWPLSKPAVAAFRKFIEADAFGNFSNASLNKAVKRACATVGVKHEHLKGAKQRVSPYDLRRSFGTDAYLKTGRKEVATHLLDHGDGATTDLYTPGAVNPARQLALDEAEAAGAWAGAAK